LRSLGLELAVGERVGDAEDEGSGDAEPEGDALGHEVSGELEGAAEGLVTSTSRGMISIRVVGGFGLAGGGRTAGVRGVVTTLGGELAALVAKT
jgi:hypothetical protein